MRQGDIGMYKNTAELFAARFPNIDPNWLETVDNTLDFLKKTSSGNGKMQTVWNGGQDGGTEWTFKPPKRPKYHKPIPQ